MMKKIVIKKQDENRRLDHFLFKMFPSVSKTIIFKAIRTKKVKVNGKRANFNYRLVFNDEISFFTWFEEEKVSHDFKKAKSNIEVIYEDDNIILMNKPCGVLSQRASNKDYDTMVDRMLKYLFDKGEYQPDPNSVFKPSLCNRLDRNTCGIIIGCKNANALEEMNSLIKNREIKKEYYCLIDHAPRQQHEILVDYLFKDRKNNQVYVSEQAKPRYVQIKTEYWNEGKWSNYSLLRVNLITGKTHQIRAHLAFHNMLIIGDSKYGIKNDLYPYQCLCSFKLTFKIKNQDSCLAYLNQKSFTISPQEIWFLKH